MRWLGFGNDPRNDPVHIVQRELCERTDTNLPTLIDALDTIVRDSYGRLTGHLHLSRNSRPLLPPAGLGVRTLLPLKVPRYALLTNGISTLGLMFWSARARR